MGSLLLRQARISDAKEIAKVQVLTWQSTYRGHIPDSYLQNLDIEQSAKNWAKRIESPVQDSQTIVAVFDGVVVGYIGVGPNRDLDAPKTGEVYTIYVYSSHQSMGIGSELVREGIEFLKSKFFDDATLWVFNQNAGAIRYYESHGWKPTGKSKLDKLGEFELLEIQYTLNF